MLSLKKALAAVGGVAIVAVATFIFAALAQATSDSSWLAPAPLTLQKQADLSVIPRSWNGNIDCMPESSSSCVINTPYGSATTNSSVSLTDSNYRPVLSYIENRQRYIPIPNSSTFITYTTEPPYGFYLYFNYNFLSSINKVFDASLGQIVYKVVQPPSGKLEDVTHHRLAADYTSISFSENGQWMVVSEPNVAVLRINLQTFEVLPFASGFNYTIGLSPAPQTAITNDGRYAVVASKDFNRFDIYDLSTCAAVPATITGPVSCQSRNLQALMLSQVAGYSNVTNLRFISNDTLSLYAIYNQGSSRKTAKYILSTGAGVIHQQDYLALGDSYISGEGAFQYLQGTDTADNKCHVSLVSYPYLLGQELNFNSYHSAACSGAKINDIINTTPTYTGQIKNAPTRSELENNGLVPSILTNFQQGYIDQLDFVKQYQPKIITISIGGNDIGFSARLRSCILSIGTCYSTYEDRLEFVREVNRTFPRLVDTYTKIKNSGAADAKIYVIGYPQIAKANGNCALNVRMNNDELLFTQQAIDYLDAVIKNAAAKASVFYVDVQDALYGHRLCEAGPGSVAMNGVTAGNDFPDLLGGPIGRETYHPNAFAHQLLENKILTATHNLTDSMPVADLNAAPPAETGLEILNAPHSGRAVRVSRYNPEITDDLIYRQQPANIYVSGGSYALAPNTTLQAELHSTPISLGSYTTDSNGDLTAQITIPSDVESGYHSLHFYGTDITGQSIDIYQTIYVAASSTDLDGNGIADNTQACVGVTPSGIDYDQDGIDDACDGYISLPPPPLPLVTPTSSGSQTDNQSIQNIPASSATTQEAPSPADSFDSIFQSLTSSTATDIHTPSGSLLSQKVNKDYPTTSYVPQFTIGVVAVIGGALGVLFRHKIL